MVSVGEEEVGMVLRVDIAEKRKGQCWLKI